MVNIELHSPRHVATFPLNELKNRIRSFLHGNRITVPAFTAILELDENNIPDDLNIEIPQLEARNLYIDFGSVVHQLTFYGTLQPDNNSANRLEFASTMMNAIISASIGTGLISFQKECVHDFT